MGAKILMLIQILIHVCCTMVSCDIEVNVLDFNWSAAREVKHRCASLWGS